jgi:hypothetical protein
LGDLYGHVLSRLLGYQMSVGQAKSGGLYVHMLDASQSAMPTWTVGQVQHYLEDHYRSLEPFLDLGAFHHLLPIPMRRQAVVQHFDIARFVHAITHLEVSAAADELADKLSTLI